MGQSLLVRWVLCVCVQGGSAVSLVTNPVTELFYGQFRAEGEHEGQ